MSIRKNMLITMTLTLVAGVLVAVTAVSCSAKDKKAETPVHKAEQVAVPEEKLVQQSESKPAVATKKKLLFFLNPYGRPCQMQDAIINEKKDDIAALANLQYIKTSEPSDRHLFGQYGIRGLPSLIVLDENGKELHRFTPGVQESGSILSALK